MRLNSALQVSILIAMILAKPVNAVERHPGSALYQGHCASCHGAELEGQPNWRSLNPEGTLPAPPHDESGHTWHHGDQLLFEYVKHGGAKTMASRGAASFKSAMPGFVGALSDDEIWDVLAYLKSHWSQRARAYQRQMTANEP